MQNGRDRRKAEGLPVDREPRSGHGASLQWLDVRSARMNGPSFRLLDVPDWAVVGRALDHLQHPKLNK